MTIIKKIRADKTILAEYLVLLLLAARPALDVWRDIGLGTLGSHTISLNAGLSFLMLLAAGFIVVQERLQLQKMPLRLAWPLLLAWSLASFFISTDRTATLLEVVKLVNVAALFFVGYVLYRQDPKPSYTRLTIAAGIGAAVPITLAIYQEFTKTGMTIDGIPNRIFGSLAHPNILALFCLLLLALFVRAKENGLAFTRLHYGAIIILLGVIVGTYTRSVWLALLIGLAIYLFKTKRRIFYTFSIVVVAFYAIFSPLNYWLGTYHNIHLQNNSVVRRLTSRPANADSIVWRWWVARDSVKISMMRPIAGFGYGTFPEVWAKYRDAARSGDPSSEAHNEYVRTLVETGLIGLILYLVVFAALIKDAFLKAKKSRWTKYVFLLSVVLYCLLAGSENLLHHTAGVWWVWFVWGAWSVE